MQAETAAAGCTWYVIGRILQHLVDLASPGAGCRQRLAITWCEVV